MSIHPQGESCGHVRYWFECLLSVALLRGMKDEDLTVEVNEVDRVLSVRGKRESVVSVDEDPWQGRRHSFPHRLLMVHCSGSTRGPGRKPGASSYTRKRLSLSYSFGST